MLCRKHPREGEVNEVTCIQLFVLPAAQPSPCQATSHFPHCVFVIQHPLQWQPRRWWMGTHPAHKITGEVLLMFLLLFWQQVTLRRKEAALKSFTALTSTLQLSNTFAVGEKWSTSVFLDIFIRTTSTFISLKEMRQIPKHSISLQIFLLAQLSICYEKRCALELYLSNQSDLMLSNINILCSISTIITLKKNQDFSCSVMSFEVQSVTA